MTHDYKRNGTTSLYSALEIATGEVTGACYPRHGHQEFLAFLNRIVKAYPRRPLHVVLDNSSTHSTPEVKRWLGRHPRVHFHFTPTSASWMNMVEIWFSILTKQQVRRGVYHDVPELSPRSSTSSAATTNAPNRSSGPEPPIESSRRQSKTKTLQKRCTSARPAGSPAGDRGYTRPLPTMRPRVLLSVLLCIAAAGSVPAHAGARVPQGFVGMSGDGPLFGAHVDLGRQLDTMVSSGVESLRVVFSWSQAQPYPSWDQVPAGQARRFTHAAVPTDFAATDQIVGLAATRRIKLLPVVLYAPGWDVTVTHHTNNSLGQPANDGPYAAYLTLLVNRYGPHGSYWRAHRTIPKVPIRMWQIWNEPSGSFYWPVQPFQSAYVALLRAAHDAIKRADPGARVILAGFPNNSWDIIDSVYRVAGAQRLFDAVAVHPYTAQPQGVITILQRVRAVMESHGDARKPMFATEVGWPASLGLPGTHDPFETTATGQANKISQVLRLLAGNRRSLGLAGFDVFTWVGNQTRNSHLFAFAGLFRVRTPSVFVAKPAFGAFRQGALALERCRQKASVATRCAKPS